MNLFFYFMSGCAGSLPDPIAIGCGKQAGIPVLGTQRFNHESLFFVQRKISQSLIVING